MTTGRRPFREIGGEAGQMPAPPARFKPYPVYKDSGVEWLGTIPSAWDVIALKRLGSIRYGLGEPPRELTDGIPFIRATNVQRGTIVASDLVKVDPEDVPWARDPRLLAHDIIVVRSGAYTGDSAIVPAAYEGGIAGYDMVLRVRRAVPKFVAWALLSKYVLERQIELCRTRAAQPHLNAEELGGVLVVVPPAEEQECISEFLDRETAKIDALVAKKERLIELLQERRTALITRAVTKGLDPTVPMKDSGVEWLGEIPAHWEVERIRHVVRRIEQGWSPECENREADEDEWGVLKAGCVNRGLFIESEHKALPSGLQPVPELEIVTGDLLMSRASGSRELVGSVAVVPRCRPRLLLCDKLFRLHVSAGRTDRRFLALAMNSRTARWQIEVALSGGSGLANNIAQQVVKDLIIPFPSRNEQESIVALLDRETVKLDALMAKVVDAVERIWELRTALISAAVTGKIDVREEAA